MPHTQPPNPSPFNFDQVIDRRHTDSLKYDAAVKRGMPADVRPFWVADMDFPAPPPVLEALRARVEHGIFGYVDLGASYYQAIQNWWRDYFNYSVAADWIVTTPGVVFSLNAALRAFSRPGDAVMLQTPVYYPFFSLISNNQRRQIASELIYEQGNYRIDFDDVEAKIKKHRVKMLVLCSPHNPGGRVWTKPELLRLGEICLKYGVTVLADEIHGDFTTPGHPHFVFAGLAPELERITVTCVSPSKTFNLAGLQCSQAFIAEAGMRAAFQAQVAATGYDEANVMGMVACRAAYEQGRPWLEALLDYLAGNTDYVGEFLARRLPRIKPGRREGTYMLWLDCRELGLSQEELDQRIVEKGNIWLYTGVKFGAGGAGFQRLNLACPRPTLTLAMEGLARAL
ncbi:MAG: pyridoxal phosphate-dependent aminotransferase [Peptococcaceae bacterium]|jgi:cystathionine beta-lyase|nr:pyridoxal phosphate-dependent aminotransferase [Peptococcaceae bacterium]